MEGAAFAESTAPMLLGQADIALAGGDAPRARDIAEQVLARPDVDVRDAADAWKIVFRVACLHGDAAELERVVDALTLIVPGEARQEIRARRVDGHLTVDQERALLARVSAQAAAAAESEAASAEQSGLTRSRYSRRPSEATRPESAATEIPSEAAPAPLELEMPEAMDDSLAELMDRLDEDDDASTETASSAPAAGGSTEPDAEEELPFMDTQLFRDELETPVHSDELPPVRESEDADDLPYILDDLGNKSAGDVHRIVADHPGTTAVDLVRRYAREQARRTEPAELEHSYRLAQDFWAADRFEEAAHLLVPVATIENPQRLGALELLTQCLLELDRLQEAEAYLRAVIPEHAVITDKRYAALLYWLGQIEEEVNAPKAGQALMWYLKAIQLDGEMMEAKRRIRVLVG